MKRTPLVQRTPLKRGRRLRWRSPKTARLYATERVPLVVEILGERPWCERCRNKPSTDVHEKVRRSQASKAFLDKSICVALCRKCHDWVSGNPGAAYDEGWVMWSWEYHGSTNA